ncbi:MAG: hypothetical protein OQK48_06905 [Sulfurimonas sp.]|uniref:hypothetical protein n=1 Tax=Sulfurimonas sp. TaxID=2022749 RepID=UPI0026250E8D|nr:hypothetical protein [Sulfurimonas sp.]MCW8895067.1 hypothetical protein [Sulfurimonas sp.]MCW8954659.1 hypothetical protein [Sulfurimonas sp.]MCW9067137.1 hypothetical protein [Sulfurimonas sp.]
MKIIFITLALVSFVYADEMQRIEAIVKDITELRGDYEECQAQLKDKKITNSLLNDSTCKKYEDLYKQEKNKNIILKAQTDYNDDLLKSNKSLAASVETLKKQIKKQKKLLISKDNEINKLLNNKKICKKENVFPKLMMKQEVTTTKFKARPFRLKIDSDIYDSIDGNKIDEWSKGTSFTSNEKTDAWVKITGYFVNKKWKKSQKDMWIKKSQVSQR